MNSNNIKQKIKLIKSRKDIPLFLKKVGVKTIIEVGVSKGKYLKKLAQAEPEVLIGVDPWDTTNMVSYNESLEETDKWYKRLTEWSNKQNISIQLIRDYSLNAVKQFYDEFFDFVYLDADHSYESVKKDLESWWPKVKKNGILSGHDYREGKVSHKTGLPFGVYEAVNEFVKKHDLKDNFYTTKDKLPTYFILKNN